MIYLADDYINKYQDVLAYIIGRAISEGYSTSHIEKTIAYSSVFSSLEKSDITEIAFTSSEMLYNKLFNSKRDNDYFYNPFDAYGWAGYIYIHLFFDLRITFELLFIIAPIDRIITMYHLYHEMDYRQTLADIKNTVKHSYLNIIMESKGISTSRLAALSGVSSSTISALRYGNRDINKLAAYQLIKIANSLRVKAESLLSDIGLVFDS